MTFCSDPDPHHWLTYPDPDPDPAFFVSGWQIPKKKRSFCLLVFEGKFTSVFIDKKSGRTHKIVEIKVFLTFLLVDGRIQIRTKNDGSESGRPINIRIQNTGFVFHLRWYSHIQVASVKSILALEKTAIQIGFLRPVRILHFWILHS
jgi:hypothetical protein